MKPAHRLKSFASERWLTVRTVVLWSAVGALVLLELVRLVRWVLA